jgi:hypothetical protein
VRKISAVVFLGKKIKKRREKREKCEKVKKGEIRQN